MFDCVYSTSDLSKSKQVECIQPIVSDKIKPRHLPQILFYFVFIYLSLYVHWFHHTLQYCVLMFRCVFSCSCCLCVLNVNVNAIMLGAAMR